MAEAKKLVPKRRFKEFQNAEGWEQQKLGDLTNRYDNLRIPVTASDRVSGNIPYYGANGIQGYVDGYTHEGEFILVAEDGANDLKNYPVRYVNGKIWVNNHAHVLQAKGQIADNKFIRYAISQIDIEPYLVGGGRAKLNANIMMEICINVPNKLEEQVHHGIFFNNLDNLITLHQRKLDKIKSMKKAYLYEMFPAEGERKPKRRFKGFTDDWELRKLGDVVDLFGGNAFSSQNSVDTRARWLKIANVGTGQLKWNDVSFLPTSYLDEYSSYRLKVGDYVMALTRPILNHELKIAKIDRGDILLNQRVAKLIFSGDAKFGYQMLRKRSTIDKIENELAGTDPPNLSANTLNYIDVRVPSLTEQKKIGNFFRDLDNLITLHQHKLDKLKNLKKAYLNEMFI